VRAEQTGDQADRQREQQHAELRPPIASPAAFVSVARTLDHAER
jgi:hypothetical protein